MCILCDSFKKNELTIVEAWSNYSEMAETMEPEHTREVYMMLIEAMRETKPKNILSSPSLDKIRKNN